MNDTFPPLPVRDSQVKDPAVSSLRIKAAAWTAGLSGFFVLSGYGDSSDWPSAFLGACVLAMVGYVCHLILYYR